MALLLTYNYLFKTNYSFQILVILYTQSGAVIFLREVFNRHFKIQIKKSNFSKNGTFDVVIIHRVGVVWHSILVYFPQCTIKFTETPANLSTVQICHAEEEGTHRNIKQNIMNGGYSTIFEMNIPVVHHALSAL